MSKRTGKALENITKANRKNWLGKHHSKETKEKIRKICLERKKRLGYLISIKSRKKISKTMKRKSKGEKNNNWKGGISKQKGYSSFIMKRRRANKYNNGGSHTLGQWENLKAQYNWTCSCCKKQEPKIKLTEDHIIPLSKGGSDNIENIQPLCMHCNAVKYTKIIKFEV